ncbi:hypothetical protein GCM10007242_43520 [Pigmentiphaga litoralis]|nr:hypothetical protein GCM10007242_43520 [Pigmentiphaga litoralis]
MAMGALASDDAKAPDPHPACDASQATPKGTGPTTGPKKKRTPKDPLFVLPTPVTRHDLVPYRSDITATTSPPRHHRSDITATAAARPPVPPHCAVLPRNA